jgi:heme A synthase
MPRPLTVPAAAQDTVAFDPFRRPRWARIAAWGLVVVLALVAFATTGLRLLVLPWPMALALGAVLGFALALLLVGVLLIMHAMRRPAPPPRRRR